MATQLDRIEGLLSELLTEIRALNRAVREGSTRPAAGVHGPSWIPPAVGFPLPANPPSTEPSRRWTLEPQCRSAPQQGQRVYPWA